MSKQKRPRRRVGVKPPEQVPSSYRVFTPDEMQKLILTAEKIRLDFGKILEIYLLTGLRVGEGVMLESKDVDLLNHVIEVPGKATKTGGRRRIPLSGRCRDLVGCMIGTYGKPIPLSSHQVLGYFREVLRVTGLSGKFHDIRKSTYGILTTRCALSDTDASSVLGHRNPDHEPKSGSDTEPQGNLRDAAEKLVQVLWESRPNRKQ